MQEKNVMMAYFGSNNIHCFAANALKKSLNNKGLIFRQYLITRIQEWRIEPPPLTDQIILTPAGGLLSH